MIANTNLSSGPYPTNGILQTFPVTFTFLANADVIAFLINSTTGVITTLVLNSDYSLTGAGNEAGGSLVTAIAQPTGYTIVILHNEALVQDTNLTNQGSFAFYAAAIENQFDYITILIQQLAEILGRAFKTAPGTQPMGYTPITGNIGGNTFTFPITHPTLAGAQIVPVSDGWAFVFNGATSVHITAQGIVP